MGYRCPSCGETFESYHEFWGHVATEHIDAFYEKPDQYLESPIDD